MSQATERDEDEASTVRRLTNVEVVTDIVIEEGTWKSPAAQQVEIVNNESGN